MTRAKKTASTKRRPAARSQSKAGNRAYRFLRALLLSSLASFGTATYVLKPQWPAQFTPQAILDRLGWPGQDTYAPVAVQNGALTQTRFAECPQFFPQGNLPAVPARQNLRCLLYTSDAADE